MTAEKKYFIELLSSYVNRTAPEGQKADYGELFRIAEIHDVGGIIANQLKQIPSEFQPEGEFKSNFNQLLGYTVKNYAVREMAYSSAKEFLNSAKCPHLFVKGVNVKEYYPDPELRTSGDIDVIVNTPLESINSFAENNSATVKEYVSNTLTLVFNSVELEIHSEADVKSDYFNDIFSLAEKYNKVTGDMELLSGEEAAEK